jgi:hypothetical protein
MESEPTYCQVRTTNMQTEHIKLRSVTSNPPFIPLLSTFILLLSISIHWTLLQYSKPEHYITGSYSITTMSSDSTSSAASGPLPTTPTELVSIEMNRFDNAWARLDENVKAPIAVEEVDPLWKQVEVRPTQVPGQTQTHFLQMNDKVNLVLQSTMHVATLHRAIALAQRLIFGEIGRVLANEKQDEATVAEIDRLSKSYPWTVELEDFPATGQLIRYNQGTPRQIGLCFEVSHFSDSDMC